MVVVVMEQPLVSVLGFQLVFVLQLVEHFEQGAVLLVVKRGCHLKVPSHL